MQRNTLSTYLKKSSTCSATLQSKTRERKRKGVGSAAFHVPGSFLGLGGLEETKMFLSHPLVKLSIMRSLHNREEACSASDLQDLHFESYVWRAVSSHSSHHPQEVLLAQFSLYLHKSGLRPDSFHFICIIAKSSEFKMILQMIRW